MILNNVKITVIVSAYNLELYIEECLKSIMNQTYKNLEIIVINDGSTDNTGKIINKLAKIDSRVIPIHQKNQGLVMVRENGIRMASGGYVTFVDGDDQIEPDMYEKLLKNAIEFDADISHCGMKFCWPDGKEEEHYGTKQKKVQNNFEGQKDLLEGSFIEPSLCNKLYKKILLEDSCLDVLVLNNEDLLRNFILFKRSKKSIFEDFSGYRYMQYEKSMSKDKSKYIELTKHILKARNLILNNCDDEIYPYAKKLLLSTYVNIINQTVGKKDNEIKNLSINCRNELKKEKSNIHFLIRRQRIVAYLILYFPMLHKMIYKIYERRYRNG